MSSYIIETTVAGAVLYLIYRFILLSESQQSFKRYYLLGATILPWIIPSLTMPFGQSININYPGQGRNEPAISQLGNSNISGASNGMLESISLNDIYWVGGILLALFMATALVRIWIIYKSSKKVVVEGRMVFQSEKLDASFSFFRLIFSNSLHPSIIAHEEAHGRLWHTIDLLLLNINRILLWWNPISWFLLREMKMVHEYQADELAAKEKDIEEYRKILISASMASHGFLPENLVGSLANSFHDGALFKRLNAMKNTKKKISKAKISLLGTLTAMVVILLSCTQDMQEITDNVSESYEISDGAQKLVLELKEKYPGAEFKVIDLHLKEGEDLEVLKAKIHEMDLDQELVEAYHMDKNKGIHEVIIRNGGKLELATEAMKDEDGVYKIVDEVPAFEGGMEGFYKYITDNLEYPQQARKIGVQGTVYVQFVVNKDGSISDAVTLKGIGAGCDKVAADIIGNAPSFKPGLVNGEPVRTRMVLPVVFKLSKDEDTTE